MSEKHMIEAIHDLQRTVWRSMMVSTTLSVLLAIAVCTALNYIHRVELLQEIQALRATTYLQNNVAGEQPAQ